MRPVLSEAILELKNVTYRKETITLLDNVSFTLTKGDNVTIFGPEGAGISPRSSRSAAAFSPPGSR